MKTVQQTATKDPFGLEKYLLPAILIAITIYFISVYYTETIVPKDEEEAALAATIFFMFGLYIGRYIAQIWALKSIPDSLLMTLSIVSIGCIIWLFVHAEFPLQNRASLNLMLYYLPLFTLSITLGMLIKLGRLKVHSQILKANARAEQSQSELHLLQSQLSPHFLFNTLNNLYGLSLTQPDKIPALLLKLSDLLRYSVYDTKELFVLLSDELAYIQNYIEFEKIRMGDRLILSTSIDDSGSQSDLKIAPMLLIVFIENAFKHSKNTTDQHVSIHLSLKIWGNSILFSVKNSRGAEPEESPILEKSRGLGLANVRKRLELLYPNAHDLTLEEKDNFYTVMLQIKVK